jgi:hypothetical protein
MSEKSKGVAGRGYGRMPVEREIYDSAFVTIWMDCLGFASEEEEDWLRQVPYCVDYDEASPWALLIEC